MSLINSTELNQLLSFTELFGTNTDSASGTGSSIANSIWTALDSNNNNKKQTKKAGRNNKKNKTNKTTTNILNKVWTILKKFFSSLVSAEKFNAESEVAQNASDAANISKETAQTLANTQQESLELNQAIESTRKSVSEVLSELDDKNNEVEKEKEEINNAIDNIQNLQSELAQTQDPVKQKELLNQIQGLSAEITKHTLKMTALNTDITKLQDLISVYEDSIEKVSNYLTELETKTEQQIEENSEKLTEETVDNTTSEATGIGINIPTATDLEITAAAASSNPYTASAAPKLTEAAVDQGTAGETRITGSSTNTAVVGTGIGTNASTIQILAQNAQAIGRDVKEASNLIGRFNSAVSPIITSIGSYVKIEDTNNELKDACEEDLGSIENVSVNNSNQTSQTTTNTQRTTTNNTTNKNQTGKVNDLKTPDVEIECLEA